MRENLNPDKISSPRFLLALAAAFFVPVISSFVLNFWLFVALLVLIGAASIVSGITKLSLRVDCKPYIAVLYGLACLDFVLFVVNIDRYLNWLESF